MITRIASMMRALLLVTALSVGGLARAADLDWLTDLKAAKAKALAEKKDILVDFSGSDWCGWCIKLDKEVFSQPAFREAAAKDYVFVLIDFPRRPENTAKQSEAQKTANRELSEQFNVGGFPTVILMDAAGIPYAKTGYEPGGPEAYLKHLATFREARDRRAGLAKELAQPGLAGVEKAKLLDQLIQASDAELDADAIAKNTAEVIQLDADNALGLKAKYQVSLKLNEVSALLEKRDADGALKVCEAILADFKPTGETLQSVRFEMGNVYFAKQDMDGVRRCLDEALKAAPQSDRAERIRKLIKRFAPAPAPAAEK